METIKVFAFNFKYMVICFLVVFLGDFLTYSKEGM